MMWNKFSVMLAMGPAPTAPGTQANPKGEMMKLVGMMLIMGLVMYFIMIRPQRQRQKQLEALLKSLRPGDKVLTSSGIVGVVLSVKEKTVTLRTGETKIEILKGAVSEVTERSSEASSQS